MYLDGWMRLAGLTAVLAPMAVYILFATHKRPADCWRRFILLAYLLVIVLFTLILKRRGVARSNNLTPFWTYRNFWHDELRWQAYMNVFLFVPLGFFLPFSCRTKFWLTFLLGMLLSVLIETIQYFTYLGLCEFDDVFHNAVGTAIGHGYFYVVTKLDREYRKRIDYCRKRKEREKMPQTARTGAEFQMSAAPKKAETPSVMEPTVSVIMGTYNCEATISAAVSSILSQTLDNVELIICDDASTDGTYSILERLKNDNPYPIKLLRNEKNSYLANCLNRCLQEAKGQYIARMDGDDISLPKRLEKQLQYLEAHPEIDMVGTGMRMIMDWGGTKEMHGPEHPDRNTLKKTMPFFHATIMARSSVFEALGGYTEGEATKRSEDIDFYCRFFLAEMRGANLQDILYQRSETDEAMKRRRPKARVATYKTKIRCFKKLNYSVTSYICETLLLYKCLVPYPLLKAWRKLRQD